MDLVVGFPISSAATEAMIAGIPAFHFDPFALKQHYWERIYEKKIPIFYTIEKLYDAVRLYIESKSLNGIKINELSLTVNAYGDLLAKQRMQEYLEFLTYPNNKVEERIKFANKMYVKKYGVYAIRERHDLEKQYGKPCLKKQ